MKINDAFNDYFSHCMLEKQLDPKTIKAYRIDLDQFQKFLSSNEINLIEDIGKDQIKLYYQQLISFAPKTIKRKLAATRAFFNYHEFEENIVVNPFRKVKTSIKIPKQLPIVLSLEQIKKILNVAYLSKENCKKKDSYTYIERLRDIAVLELLFSTGLRVSELCNLTIGNIEQDYSLIKVNGKGSKERMIPITNNEVREALKLYYLKYNANINNYFFVNRLKNKLSEQSVRYLVRKYSKKANIALNTTPHVFRHSFATLLLEEDVDIRYIQSLLGHSSINTTQIYTHVNSRKKSEILTLKHPRNSFEM